MPARLTSSPPSRRHYRLYHPYPHSKVAQRKQIGDLGSSSDLSSFNYVGYDSTASSPTERLLSPHVRRGLHLQSAASHSEPANPPHHQNSTSPLYGTNPAHSGRLEEPIDLSAMYDEQNVAIGHEVHFQLA
jgi:hypothetical protein